jgi:hypothetical protein
MNKEQLQEKLVADAKELIRQAMTEKQGDYVESLDWLCKQVTNLDAHDLLEIHAYNYFEAMSDAALQLAKKNNQISG